MSKNWFIAISVRRDTIRINIVSTLYYRGHVEYIYTMYANMQTDLKRMPVPIYSLLSSSTQCSISNRQIKIRDEGFLCESPAFDSSTLKSVLNWNSANATTYCYVISVLSVLRGNKSFAVPLYIEKWRMLSMLFWSGFISCWKRANSISF